MWFYGLVWEGLQTPIRSRVSFEMFLGSGAKHHVNQVWRGHFILHHVSIFISHEP